MMSMVRLLGRPWSHCVFTWVLVIFRLTNSLMMYGRNNGKKLMAVRVVKHAMEIIHLLTDQNPIQVIVDAIINRCVYLTRVEARKFRVLHWCSGIMVHVFN